MNKPIVTLLHHTPLWVCANAIRTCWNSFDKGDDIAYDKCNYIIRDEPFPEYAKKPNFKFSVAGEKNIELIKRVGIKNGHESVLEHLNMSFFIEKIPRGVLQELSRHRIGISPSIESSRFTLKKLLKDLHPNDYPKYFYFSGSEYIDSLLYDQIVILVKAIKTGKSNDDIKHLIPEGMYVKGLYTLNMRAFRHLVYLRQGKEVYQPFRGLVEALIEAMPKEYKRLFDHNVTKLEKEKENNHE
jgi:thymidylate synthase (FAD)